MLARRVQYTHRKIRPLLLLVLFVACGGHSVSTGVAPARRPAASTAVTVVVRDVLSGRAPPAAATARLTAAGYRDSVTARSTPGDSALLLHLGRPGSFHKYSIVVQSPGFRDWRAEDVPDVVVPCGGLWFPPLQAWLIPL